VPRYDVRNKTALITGGARGIGLGIGTALAARGSSIALVDLEADAVAQAAEALGPGRAIGVAADVTNVDAIEAAVAEAVDRFGGVDIVVANAGIAPAPASARMMDPDEFERVVEVDLLGVYRTVHAGMEQIVARRGHAVLVSSVYAFMNGVLLSPYAVAKAGVEQLGRALRVELAVHGASATVAYFGFVDTRMVQEGLEQRQAIAGDDEELLPPFLRRMISPQQAGEAVARAIERRRARVIAPRWWAALSTLRGVLNPAMDYAAAHAPKVQDLLRQADAAAEPRVQRPS
jgi:NAD(P)-dependent dehydrogenase (short-subunit alcohol dehydrogenase family)